jgi:hypothetical protein
MKPEGPFLVVAAFCAKAELEGKELSIVNLLSDTTLDYSGDTPPACFPPIPVTASVVFQAGADLSGRTVVIKPPRTVDCRPAVGKLDFASEGEFAILTFPLWLVFLEEGIHWFDILLDGEAVTRISFRLRLRRLPG